jgi:flagellar protein FlgJ
MLETVQTGIQAGGIAGQEAPGRAKNDPAKILDAAKQFEALLLAEMLKSMREASDGGWLGAEGDPAGDSAMALAQEQFAQALAQGGGLGLSKLVAAGLVRSGS